MSTRRLVHGRRTRTFFALRLVLASAFALVSSASFVHIPYKRIGRWSALRLRSGSGVDDEDTATPTGRRACGTSKNATIAARPTLRFQEGNLDFNDVGRGNDVLTRNEAGSGSTPPQEGLSGRRVVTAGHSPGDVHGGSLGDIMSMGGMLQTQGDDATSTRTLAERYGITHPLDRVALTANGNLQRLVSSYYDAPVAVLIDSCVQRNATVWDRAVHLSVYNQTFCTAKSVITIHDSLCRELVKSQQVGLGQLFRFLDLLPEFTLVDAGLTSLNDPRLGDKNEILEDDYERRGGGGFWRDYRLDCNELSCRIKEEFCPGMWNLRPGNLRQCLT